MIPRGTILTPSETAAVVGGNVLTTQRIVDVIFRAFETCAASQVSDFPARSENVLFSILRRWKFETLCIVQASLGAAGRMKVYEWSARTRDSS